MINKALTAVSEVENAYHTWKTRPLASRKETIVRIKEKFLVHSEKYAKAITTDMNKPLAQSLAEVKKCATLCDYYLTHIDDFLRPQPLQSSWTESYVRLDPPLRGTLGGHAVELPFLASIPCSYSQPAIRKCISGKTRLQCPYLRSTVGRNLP